MSSNILELVIYEIKKKLSKKFIVGGVYHCACLIMLWHIKMVTFLPLVDLSYVGLYDVLRLSINLYNLFKAIFRLSGPFCFQILLMIQGHVISSSNPRCLYNKVGFQWEFFVSCGSQKISANRSGNGRSSGKCPLTSNGHHLHSRRCCFHLISFCDVSKKCYRCSRLFKAKKTSFQPTFVVTYTKLCSFSIDNLWAMQCFESTIFGRLK
jgi:hypothetical protein